MSTIKVSDDVQVLALARALASEGLTLSWEDGGPVIVKVQPAGVVECHCGKPAAINSKHGMLCTSCHLEAERAEGVRT